jgi:hypothetical protein
MAVAPPRCCPRMRATPPEIDPHRPSLYTPNPSWPPPLNRTPASSPCTAPPMGFTPKCASTGEGRKEGEEGRKEEGGGAHGGAGSRPLLPAPGASSRSRRAAALGSHAEPWMPSSTRSWSCRGRGEDCRPGEPATPPLLHPLRCASTLRPGGAHRPGTAMPRCTGGGGGAHRRHCVLALTTGRTMPS